MILENQYFPFMCPAWSLISVFAIKDQGERVTTGHSRISNLKLLSLTPAQNIAVLEAFV